MRTAVLLAGGLLLIAAGVAALMLEVPGRWIVGPALVVAGVVLKLVGMLRDPQPAPGTGRTKTTLGTAPASPTAAGTPAAAPLRAVARTRQTGQAS